MSTDYEKQNNSERVLKRDNTVIDADGVERTNSA